MDALRSFVRFWKKWHFWILCPFVVIMAAAGWVIASSKISDEFKRFADKISSEESRVRQITRKTNHPNARYQEGMDQLIATRQESVRKAWDTKWQQQENQLQWPQSFHPRMLDIVQQMRPIEKVPHDDRSLPPAFREHYRDHIKNELPKLARTIDARWRAESAQSHGGYVPYGMDALQQPDNSLVYWNPQNQRELQQSRFTWSQGEEFEAPTTMEILYAQEDLWILQALMNMIRSANEGATDRSRAVVKQIDFIRIANDAVTKAGKVAVVGATGQGATGLLSGGGGYDYSGSYSSGSPSGSTSGGSTSGPVVPSSSSDGYDYSSVGDSGGGSGYGGYGYEMDGAVGRSADMRGDPAENRYVNRDFEPLSADQLRQATLAEDPGEAYLAVAKRVPVQLRLLVDSRRLNQLLAECANGELTYEVRQLRINRPPSKKTSPMQGTGGYGYGGYGEGGYGDVGGGDADSDAAGGVPSAVMEQMGGGYGYGYGDTSGGGYGYGRGESGPPGIRVYDPSTSIPRSVLMGTSDESGYGTGYGSGGYGYGDETNTLSGVPVRLGFFDCYVELLGIIYIYNPVNPAVLGTEQGGLSEPALARGL